MANPNDKTIGLTREDLLAILQEIKKPVKSDEELALEGQKAEQRATLAATLKAEMDRKAFEKQNCSHMRRGGTTTAVLVPNLNKLYCQACTAWISDGHSVPLDGEIVNPQLFNHLCQAGNEAF